MAKCEGATFARSLTFMPLINQAFLSPSLAKLAPSAPQGATCAYPYCVRSHPYSASIRVINARKSSQSGSAALCAQIKPPSP